jgi:hypothetical protein
MLMSRNDRANRDIEAVIAGRSDRCAKPGP